MSGTYTDWLPALITVDDIAHDWDRLIEESYQVFIEDYLNCLVFFKKYPVHYKRHPEINGKHGTFHHIISRDRSDKSIREEHLDRIQRIRWAKAIIENSDDPDVLKWENKRHGDLRICLYLLPEKYVVVLEPRKDITGNTFMLLWTAYIVDRERDHQRLIKEHKASKMADAAYL